MNTLLKNSLTYHNFCAAKLKANQESQTVCQLFSDITEKNRLSYSEPEPIPEVKQTKIPKFSVGIWNMINNLRP